MSEFDRSENLRRSIRRPRKQAPLPPTQIKNIDNNNSEPQKSSTVKRDFVASPLRTPVLEPKTKDSFDVLKQLQAQINQLEFNTAVKQSTNLPIKTAPRATRYDAMESVLNTGISDLKTNDHDDDDLDDDVEQFYRGGVRMSVQGVCRTKNDPQKVKQPSMQLQRTQSDTKKVEILRKQIKQREFPMNKKMDEEKVKN